MTSYVTHGKACICHSCDPLRAFMADRSDDQVRKMDWRRSPITLAQPRTALPREL